MYDVFVPHDRALTTGVSGAPCDPPTGVRLG